MYKFLIAIIAFGSISLHSCIAINKTKGSIKGASLLYHIPVANRDGSITDLNSSYEVYYYGDLNMYKLNYQYDSLVNDELKLREDRNNFFVFHKDSAFGYLFDRAPSLPDRRARLDSVKINSFENYRWDSLLTMKVDSVFNDSEGNLINVYKLPPTKDYPGKFTYYFYYTKKLNGIRETFSKNLEEFNKMKIFKIRMVIHEVYHEKYKMTLPERESYYEMKEIPVINSKQILEYFNKYEKLINIRS